MTLFKLEAQHQGPHVKVRVFVGPDGDHLALAGNLTFEPEQYKVFHEALHFGIHSDRGEGYVKNEADLLVNERRE